MNENQQRVSRVFVTKHGLFSEKDAGPRPVQNHKHGVKGFFLGGCVESGIGKISDHKPSEPAHTHLSGRYKGWICIQNPGDLSDEWLRAHQIVHLLTGGGHYKEWRELMKNAGFSVPKSTHRLVNCTRG